LEFEPGLSACEADVMPLHHAPLGVFIAAERSSCVEHERMSWTPECGQSGRRLPWQAHHC
jgi:hypothetical protein